MKKSLVKKRKVCWQLSQLFYIIPKCHVPIYLWHTFICTTKIPKRGRLWNNHFIIHLFVSFAASSVEDTACSCSQPLFPVHCKEFPRLFVRKLVSLLCILGHTGKFTGQSWKVQKLSICVCLPVSLLCPRSILLEETKDSVMRQKASIPNTLFIQQITFSLVSWQLVHSISKLS